MSKLDLIIDEAIVESATDDLSTDWEAISTDAKHQIKALMLDIIGPHRLNCVVNLDRGSRLAMDIVVPREQECDCGVYEMGLKVARL